MMRIFIFRCLAMLAALSGMMQVAFASEITVVSAVARASLTPTATSGAVYMSIVNSGSSDDKLLSITTALSPAAELHETTMDGDVMKMRAIEGPTLIAAGSTFEMKPGGFHIMLTGLKAPLKKGDSVVFELLFEKAGAITVDVPVGDVASDH